MAARPSWLELARELSAEAVAEALGLEPGRPASGQPTFACPACRAPTRHTKSNDKRGAVGLTGDGMGWRCHQCEAGGDGIDLASAAVGGTPFRELSSGDRDRVRTWFVDRWPELDREALGSRPRRSPPLTPPARPVSRPEPEPLYPPLLEVKALWGLARPVTADAEVSAYLIKARALEPEELAGLARALPGGAPLPAWARGPGGSWLATGHRIIAPLFDARGELRSLVARTIIAGAEPKSLAPAGFARKGLVLADGLAVQVLAGGGLPSWWDQDVPLRVVLCEGEPDFWTWATGPEALSDLGHGPACLGLFNGGLPAELVAKLPRGATVIIAEQRDEPKGDGPTAAESYTARILKALNPRLRTGDLQAKVKRP